MRRTTRSSAYSFRKAIFVPAAVMSTRSLYPVISKFYSLGQERSKVAGGGGSRSLVLEKGRPEFADFRLFCVCFIRRNVGKAPWSAGLQTPRRCGKHLRRWIQRQSERSYQTSSELLEVAFTLRSFLRKRARNWSVILCFSVRNDEDKKCKTTGFETGKCRPGFLYFTLLCFPCFLSFLNSDWLQHSPNPYQQPLCQQLRGNVHGVQCSDYRKVWRGTLCWRTRASCYKLYHEMSEKPNLDSTFGLRS